MDQLTLQRSLTVLENRYRELREIGETRLQAWEAEKANLKQELDDITRAWEAEKANLKQELDDITHAKGCCETEIKNLGHWTDVLASEKKDLEAKLQQASLTISGFRLEKQDLESQLKEAHLKSENLNNERHHLHSELKEAREELELRMLQLLQAQEELQHYFLKSQELASAHAQAVQAEASTSEALQDVLTSTSWRMTYPVRWALDQFHLLRREGYKKGSQEIANKIASKANYFR